MRVLLAVSLALSFASGCSKSKGDYNKACEHLLDLAHKELEATVASFPADMQDTADELKKNAEAQHDSDLATCVAKAEEHGIDASCIQSADTLDEAQRCLVVRR